MATMKTKPVSFNTDNPQEKELFEFCERVPKGKFSAWVKQLISMEYSKRQQQRSIQNK